jgi:hypothetical protein
LLFYLQTKRDYNLQLKKNTDLEAKATNLSAKTRLNLAAKE